MTTARAVGPFVAAAVLSLVAAPPAQAQLEIGTWARKTTGSMTPMTMKIEACCGGGRRLTYLITAGKTKMTLMLETRLDGTSTEVLVNGKPSGETMAVKRVDAHHATNVLKMNGKQFATSMATLSADGMTLTVVTDNTSAVGGRVGKQTEVFVKQ